MLCRNAIPKGTANDLQGQGLQKRRAKGERHNQVPVGKGSLLQVLGQTHQKV